MTNYLRWDPYEEMRGVLNRMRAGSPGRTEGASSGQSFPVDISATEEDVEIKASLPGVRPEDIDITATREVVMIRAARRRTDEGAPESYLRQELDYGILQRALELPVPVQPDKVEANYEDGILRLRLPKAESLRPKRIHVSTDRSPSPGGTTGSASGDMPQP